MELPGLSARLVRGGLVTAQRNCLSANREGKAECFQMWHNRAWLDWKRAILPLSWPNPGIFPENTAVGNDIVGSVPFRSWKRWSMISDPDAGRVWQQVGHPTCREKAPKSPPRSHLPSASTFPGNTPQFLLSSESAGTPSLPHPPPCCVQQPVWASSSGHQTPGLGCQTDSW